MKLSSWRLNIPMQYLGWAITFVRAMSLYSLLGVMLWHIDPHWLVWALYWWTAIAAFISWVLYVLLDVDGDGAEGGG